MTTWNGSRWLTTCSARVAFYLALGGTALAQPQFPPLKSPDFTMSAPQGFGDRQNSWTWSMAWFRGRLYAGTNRAWKCQEQASINRVFPSIPYPPLDPEIECSPDPADLPLQAEIWCWTPETNMWEMVFRSPADVPIPDRPGKFVARDTGFRSMHVHIESDGTEALYVGGVSSKFHWQTTPGARILRSADGQNFEPIPQDAGTFLGELDNASFRAMRSYKGRFYVVAGGVHGEGRLLEANSPQLGNNAFRVVTPAGWTLFEFEEFNGFLYLGLSFNDGFAVVRTDADGPLPYQFTTVMEKGGNRVSLPNRDVLSMHEFKGRLYVGGNGVDSNFGAELFRISPDDSWDVVVGQVRDTPAGVKVPLSGLGPGFGWFLNAHMWRQEVFDGRLYVGTFDMSSILKDTPFLGPLFEPLMGFDLWATRDGVTFFPIVINGLEDKHNFGVRALRATPASGLFLGTANYWFGQEVWQGVPVGMAVASSGQRASHLTSGHLNGESTGTRSLLYWDGTGSLDTHLFRSELVEVDLAQQLGISEPVEVPGYFKEIGTTDKSYFVDTNTGPDRKFIYYVEVRDENGKVCDRSNWVTVPSATPAVTFRRAAQAISNMTIRNKFVSEPARRHVSWLFRSARRKALQGDLAELRNLRLRLESNRLQTGERILDPLAAEDLQILVSKLIGRVALFHAGILTLSDLQVSPPGANNSRTSD